MALSIPISIGLTQVFYFLFIFLTLPNFKKAVRLKALDPLRSQLICWSVVMVIASCASVDFQRSISETLKALSYPLFILLVLCSLESIESAKDRVAEVYTVLLFLIVGQAIACSVTIFSLAIGSDAKFGLPGPVTGSGQLALVLPIITGIILGASSQKIFSKQRVLSVILLLSIFLLVSVRQSVFNYYLPVQVSLLILIGYLLKEINLFSRLKNFWCASSAHTCLIALSLLPVLMTAFIFNLKRGPWLGVLLATTILGITLGRKKLLFGAICTGLSMLFLPLVRTRVLNIVADFTIAGGRERMWELGFEIASRFPLGVGPKNSVYMRVLDPYLPSTHRHLHNNFLNVLVEMGYLGGVIFIWWMVTLVLIGFRWTKLATSAADPALKRVALLAVALSTAILSWQCAGLVEYNFGDAEIRMLAYLVMALLLCLNRYLEQSANSFQAAGER